MALQERKDLLASRVIVSLSAYQTIQRKPQPLIHTRLGPYTQTTALRNSVLQLDRHLGSESMDITPELQSLHALRGSPPQQAAAIRKSVDNYPHLSFPKSVLGTRGITPQLPSQQVLRGSLPLEALGTRNSVDNCSLSSFPKLAVGAWDTTPELHSPPPLRGSPPRYSDVYSEMSSLGAKVQAPRRLITRLPLSRSETGPNQSVRLISSLVFVSEYPQPLRKPLFTGGPKIQVGMQEPAPPAPRRQRSAAVPANGRIQKFSVNDKGQALQDPSTSVAASSAGSGFMRMVKNLLMKLGPGKV